VTGLEYDLGQGQRSSNTTALSRLRMKGWTIFFSLRLAPWLFRFTMGSVKRSVNDSRDPGDHGLIRINRLRPLFSSFHPPLSWLRR